MLHAIVALSSAQDRTPRQRALGPPCHFETHRLGLRGYSSLASAREIAFIRLHFGGHPPVLRTGSNASAHAGYGVGLCTLQGCHATEPCEEFGAYAGTMVPSSSFKSRCRGISNSPVSAAEA